MTDIGHLQQRQVVEKRLMWWSVTKDNVPEWDDTDCQNQSRSSEEPSIVLWLEDDAVLTRVDCLHNAGRRHRVYWPRAKN